jgi:subtilisin family serine protease
MMNLRHVALRVGLLATALLIPLGAYAADLSKLNPRARITLEELRNGAGPLALKEMGGAIDENGNLDVFIQGNVSRSELEAAGAIIRTEVPGGIFTAFVPAAAIDAVAALPGVERINGAIMLEENLDASVPTTMVNSQRAVGPNFAGANGAGVMIGDIDSGISYAHGDFDDAAGNTRILSIWDQTNATGTPPSGFTYGSEYLPAAINAGTAQGKDTNGHGTHVMGIAAGDGSLTGGTVPAFTYAGVAPMADIVEIKSTYSDTQILDGAAYFFGLANTLGKNAVLNISLGGQYGPHDGTAPLSLGLDALVGPGKAICVSAGNDGGTTSPLSHRHARVICGNTYPSPSSAVLTLSGTGSGRIVGVDGYYDATDAINVTISHPTYGSFGPYSLGVINAAYPGVQFGTGTTKGYLYVENGASTSGGGDPEVYVEIRAGTTTGSTFNGNWTFTFTPTAPVGPENGRVDLWRFYSSTTAIAANFSSGIDDSCLLGGDIASSNNVITCGASTTKLSWTNCAGLGISFNATIPVTVVGGIASFSSAGPTRDGRTKPDIAAPGHGIGSSMTQDVTLGACTTASTYYSFLPDNMKHMIMSGTSMAAPHVTGAVALLFQKHGALTRAEIMERLSAVALVDGYTGVVPNNSWGVGKLRVDVTDPNVTVAYPNGGDVFYFGFPLDIVWVASDPIWSGVDNVDIELSRNGGTTWEVVASNIANLGVHTWTPTGPATFSALLRVTAHDLAKNAGSDLSDALFTITEQPIANEIPFFLADNTSDGVTLSWRFADAGIYTSSWVERSSSDDWMRLDSAVTVTTDGFSMVDRTAQPGVDYQYRVAAMTAAGAQVTFEPVSISASNTITEFALGRAWPNPTSTGSTVSFAVPRAAHVSVKVFDVRGRLVNTLADQEYGPGRYEVTWNGRSSQGEAVSNGIYFVNFVAPSARLVQRVMVVK